MAGALKKTMIYLGLADGDEYDEQPRATERETAPRHEVVEARRPAEPNTDVIDPETLAALAYNETELPAPPVDLKPNPDRQVVNLETHAVLDPAELQRVWVTAYIDPPGMGRIAATTGAWPASTPKSPSTPGMST